MVTTMLKTMVMRIINADSDDDGIEVGSMFDRCAIYGRSIITRSKFDIWSIDVREMFDR